ncbi:MULTISPECIES: hypothetical protein [unclassified Pseudodesulfovibrio]|uniref:hypothetical protein n=1 Tax=unclassified Pseudodesulfovibrio TaxID=2661612 RepID=UPI000FEBF231|nr:MULTISPECIES: hypothetical protein [unclassified Pseudodesulfovibrio]MCJ2166157.1 hypothetical protein [Pseudodesulfovibrio sp. S3-i]RWU02389.1 hypothetical protein DWB63_16500 [Pseudodesulfovibrio sp. S3]
MKKILFALCLILTLGLLTGCGDDVSDDPNLSEEGKTVVTEMGGPFTASEFDKFLEDLPKMPGLTAESQQDIGDASGAALSEAVMSAAKAAGWDEERFMYIYSHTMTMVSLEQMDKIRAQMETQLKDLPEEQKKIMEQMMGQQIGGQAEAMQAEVDQQVPASEQTIIKDNMAAVYTALGIE